MVLYDLEEIKNEYLKGKSLRQLEKEYGYDRKMISRELKKYGVDIKFRFNQELYNKALELCKEKKSLTAISKEVGVDRHTLAKWFESKGARTIKRKELDTSPAAQNILEKYQEGMSVIAIAKDIGRSSNYVWEILRNHGVIDQNRTSRKYVFDESIFEKINTEEKAYWLGFLYADGYVPADFRCIEIGLKAKDKGHLEKFLDFLNINPRPEIKMRDVKVNGKIAKACRIIICSNRLAHDLAKHGCIPQKSLVLEFPKWLDEELLPHFMRGYFDGDGTLSLPKPLKESRCPQLQFGIVGTEEFINDYEGYMVDIGVLHQCAKLRPTGQAFQTRHGGNKQAKKVFDFLYKDSSVYLDRKYELFNAVLGGNTERLLTGN